jgi:PAS domain S-box-containing protein
MRRLAVKRLSFWLSRIRSPVETACTSAEKNNGMGWLAFGVVYSIGYAIVGWLMRGQPSAWSWFRAVALLIPPMTGAIVVFTRRHTWRGCQWLFWATIALGLTMSAIGLTGWAADELMFKRQAWLAWPAVFALFGAMAPLFALMAQPHHGPREPLAVTTAVDIAGLAVVTGFLYSFFVIAPEGAGQGSAASASLRLVSELQQALVFVGLLGATIMGWRTPWGPTYRRLALGALVCLITLTLSNVETAMAEYQSAFIYDLTWILPFAFYTWAATLAPGSPTEEAEAAADGELTRPRPWVIFAAVALLPFIDFGLRRIAPNQAFEGFRDLSTALTIMSVPLLVARIAAERAELQQASSTTKLLAEVIEQAHDAILVVGADGRCRHANEAFCRATGFSRHELMNRHARDLMVHEGISSEDIAKVVRTHRAWRGTLTRTREDGTTFPVMASVAGIVDDEGDTTNIVSIERDISEERRLKEQLIHSERLSAVGQLVAGVAHEINNPLQGIIGFTELLLGVETNDATRRDLEQIHADANRVAKIVHHLLAFARKSTLDRAVADLSEIVRSTVILRAFEIRSANIDLREELSANVPLIVINREEIQQIVLNLLLNAEHAVKSTGRRGAITLRTGTEDHHAFVEVSDTGPGIPAELALRIFEPFFTTKDAGQGTGLGLSVSLKIAEAHGGTLSLLPQDKGSCFRLTLPSAPELHASLAAMSRPA